MNNLGTIESPVKPQQLSKAELGEMIATDIEAKIRGGALKSGSKLQSENELTRLYQANVYSVRQAIARLKKNHLLYSIPKVGVFVGSETPDRAPEPSIAREQSAVRMKLRLQSGSITDDSRGFWNHIAESFNHQTPFTEVEMDNRLEIDPAALPDVRECSSPLHFYQLGDMPALDIMDYFRDSSGGIEFLSDIAVPFWHSIEILLFNRKLLKELDIAPPAYRNYRDQLDYLRPALQKIAATPQLEIPGTVHQPIIRLGKHLSGLFSQINGGGKGRDQAIIAEYAPIFEEVTGLWREYRISHPKQYVKNWNLFMTGQMPFFMGTQQDIQTCRRDNPDFELGLYPMFAIDDTVGKIAIPLVVSAASEHPVESIRLVRHLQSTGIQRKLAESGLIPARDSEQKYLPYTQGEEGRIFLEVLKNPSEFFFRSREEHYVCMNIINVELWDCILFDKDIGEALRDILAFSRAYLNTKMDRMTMAERERWAELYG